MHRLPLVNHPWSEQISAIWQAFILWENVAGQNCLKDHPKKSAVGLTTFQDSGHT